LGIAPSRYASRSDPLGCPPLYDEIALHQQVSVGGTARIKPRHRTAGIIQYEGFHMTATTSKTRAPSTAKLLRPSTLLLAAVIALEVVGVRVLASADADPVVASIDGTAVATPAAPARHLRAGAVEVRIVAQADLPAR
jgi:hypothetical protein